MIVLAVPVVLAVLGGLHLYVWRRMVRATTAPGTVGRRAGTAVFVTGAVLLVAVFAGARLGMPFWLVRVLAWPGYLWAAVALYLLLGTLAGEAVRPVLARWLRRRAARATAPARVPAAATAPAPLTVPADGPASAPAPAPLTVPGPGPDDAAAAPPAAGMPGTPDTPPAALDRTAPDRATPDPAAPDPTSTDRTPVDPTELTRRVFVARVVAGATAVAAVGTVGRGTYGVLRGPGVKRVTVPLAKLPRGAHGFRIAVVSDVHLGPVLGRAFSERVVATVNATQPDLIAVVGDLADGSVEDLRSAVEPISRLRARHGSFFVTGNHEYFSGVEEWTALVQELGLDLLANERVELPAFDLAGVNDVSGEGYGDGPDLAAALRGRDPSRASVLMAHQPVFVDEAVRHGVDLQLSGHTHGGQLWPLNHVAALANPTVAGLERYGDTQLYVSRGAGAWGPPTRVDAPSDVTVVELASLRA
ncbi:metallophosphoesterase [Streptomyces sp. NPDC056600]|uniref:metallophosphoesterase n=1 Tax=Streptomyces sp. NPDC056600 TaxID=3345874 RepID=UPI003679EFCB